METKMAMVPVHVKLGISCERKTLNIRTYNHVTTYKLCVEEIDIKI